MPATLRALQSDITTLAVDAIANAANSSGIKKRANQAKHGTQLHICQDDALCTA